MIKNYFTPDKYSLVESINDPQFKAYMLSEVIKIHSSEKKGTFIDIGAGYGRIIPHIPKRFDTIISIDKNKYMISELKKRYPTVNTIYGDATNLASIVNIPKDSLIVILQNTLGTWNGDYLKLLKNINDCAKTSHSDVIISIFRADALKKWGLSIYSKIENLTGKINQNESNLERGLFVGYNGYSSKWFTDYEIDRIKKIMKTQSNDFATDKFNIMHFSYK